MGRNRRYNKYNPYTYYPDPYPSYGYMVPQPPVVEPMSTIKYNNGTTNIDANVTTNGILCAVGGVVVGACAAYYFMNNKK